MKYTKYVEVDGKKVYVSDEIYNALKKQSNREQYLRRLDNEYLDVNFSYKVGIENIIDKDVDIEKVIQTNILIEKLRVAMQDLSDDELYIVQKLYFDGNTLREVAKSINMAHSSLIEKRDKILKKLRKIIGG